MSGGIVFELAGLPPSKKNTRTLSMRGGRVLNLPPKSYRDWLPEFRLVSVKAARRASPGRPGTGAVIDGPFRLVVTVYPRRPASKPKRGVLPKPKRGDLDGILTSVLDGLQGATVKVGRKRIRVGGVIADDYWCTCAMVILGELRDEAAIKVEVYPEPDGSYRMRLEGGA